MTIGLGQLGTLFVALFTLYSPLSNVGAYAGLTAHLSRPDQKKLALRVLVNVLVIMLVFVWAGELLFDLLGVSSDTLRVAGGIALMSAGLPMMLGTIHDEDPGEVVDEGDWHDIAVVPMTFPLSVGGTTAAYLVTASGLANNLADLFAVSVVVLLFAGVVFVTHWFSPPLSARLSPQGRALLNRIGGVILVAISVGLITGGLRGLLPGLA